MSDFSVNDKLKVKYDEYYNGESEWRRLGAIDKASNIIDLCKAIPHNNVLDIGSGEGSVLKRLCDLGFGEMLYSLEISK